MDMRNCFFTKRGIKQWNRLAGDVVDIYSLSVFKRYLDNTFNISLTFAQPLSLQLELD